VTLVYIYMHILYVLLLISESFDTLAYLQALKNLPLNFYARDMTHLHMIGFTHVCGLCKALSYLRDLTNLSVR